LHISQTTVGWLLLAAAALTFVAGITTRSVMGRRQETVDDEELDDKILMPTFILGCGLCLTGIFLLGYEVIA
jgi:hypothetical protein